MSKIRIIIAGGPKSGKTTVARLLAYTLNNEGIASEIQDDEADTKSFHEVRGRLRKMSGVKVDIKVKQTSRKALEHV